MIPSGKDTHIFTGIMDMDTEARYFASGNYRYLLNARTTINTQGSFGALEDVMGNVLVSNPYLFNGRNKVIGSCEDIAGQSCIYFVWNELGYHGIFRWYANRVGFPDGLIETIYQVRFPNLYDPDTNPNPLSFDENKLITGVNLVDELLYWTDYNREPKVINIVRANNTNKKLSFNFYIDTADLTVATTYSFSLFIENTFAPVYGISITSSQLTLELRIKDVAAQLNADPLFPNFLTLENKNQYIEFTCVNTGNYFMSVFNTGINQAIILPENHYPDYISGTFASFPALTEDVLKRAKYPPLCAPDVSYENLDGPVVSYAIYEPKYYATLQAPTNYLGISSSVIGYSWLGFNQEFNDVNNNFTLGLTNPFSVFQDINVPGWVPNSGPKSYISSAVTQAINIGISFSISWNFPALAGPTRWLKVFLMEYTSLGNFTTIATLFDSTTIPVTVPVQTYYAISISEQRIINVQAGKKYQLQVAVRNDDWFANPTTSNGVTNLTWSGSINLDSPFDLVNIWRQGYLFRAKYYFNDNESSVLSSASKALLAPSTIINSIKINYNDFWLNNIPYLSTIKYVLLYVSADDGLTWGEIAKLYKYQFAPSGIRYDYYTIRDLFVTISSEDALLQYHAVPLKSKAQEYIDDRIWDGAILEGYDLPFTDATISVQYKNISSEPSFNNTPVLSSPGFRYGYSGYVGIVYYDNADRKSSVSLLSTNPVNIPLLYVGQGSINLISDPLTPYLSIAINNHPPDWATKYQVVVTSDISTTNYLVWFPTQYLAVNENFVTTTPALSKYWEINLDSIPYYIDKADLGTEIEYTYQKGDRVRFLCDEFGVIATTYYDAEILISIANKIYIKYNETLPIYQTGLARGKVYWIEIYTPSDKIANADFLTFYEVGYCNEIAFDSNNKKYHTSPIQNQDYTTNTPALIDINRGSTYFRKRAGYSYGSSGSVYLKSPMIMAWSQTVSDYTAFKYTAHGRTNIISDIGQQYRYSTFRFSDQYQEVLNGLSANQPLNFTQMNLNYGELNKMQVVNNDVLKLIFGNSYQVSIYVNQGVIRQAQGQSPLISVSDQVAGNSHVIQRTLGTLNAESVYVNDEGDMFGYDENEGVVWIASGNGLIQISDRGMKSVFKRYSNERKATGGISETPCVYDLYHDEYILTLGDINGFTGVTIAYNKQKQGWTSYYSFVPEYYGRVRDYVVSFKNGELWKHDVNTLAKNFYGTQYTRQLKFVSNKDFPKVKQYKALGVTGIGKNDAPSIFVPPYEGVPTGMLSSLSSRFFQTLEGIQYAHLQKDKLSPGFGGNQLQALVNGRDMKGQTIEITLENTDTSKSSIYSADVVYFYSENS